MLSREQAGEQSLLLGLTSAPCRGMEASPLPEEFCWLRRGRHPSCSTASVSGLGLLSRTRGLRIGKSALLLDATRRDSNGQFAGSVTSAPTTPLGCVAGTPRHRNSSARPHPWGKPQDPGPGALSTCSLTACLSTRHAMPFLWPSGGEGACPPA